MAYTYLVLSSCNFPHITSFLVLLVRMIQLVYSLFGSAKNPVKTKEATDQRASYLR